MQSYSGLIARLERLERPDRRLDAEIVAAALGPPGCMINPFQSVDGWDIELSPDKYGECAYWREAADVGHLTGLLEDAVAFAREARPDDGARVMAQALRAAPSPGDLTPLIYGERLARCLVAETLRAIAAEDQRATLAA